ncbi:Peptidase family M23 [Asanoa hainanensis]|uniref:Peptidase family M23 n=2 Tax=Asanoa hainanensis TaxID=560556 RepID=A0A239PH28_9ACTN|nr:M23 family metallopeptidase [Asanoa hainanensis]SNT66095.1 Peptidase family M23 [Asanoa hainanensis]
MMLTGELDETSRRRRPKRVVALVAITATLALLCCGGGTAAFFLDGLGNDSNQALSSYGCGAAGPLPEDGDLPRVSGYSPTQLRNAATIINVGADLKVPPKGWVIAIATAMQESSLNNLGNLGSRNDHDSLGLFQQRPSQGWGTPAQVQDPVYASRKFYQKLVKVRGWEQMSLTDAAQAVQRSAFPDAYAKHEPDAAEIVNMLADGAARAVGANSTLTCAAIGDVAASGWTAPVKAGVVSGFRTSSRPSHQGVDLGASRGDDILAAAAGTVIVSRCDNDQTPPFRCDRDGSPSTPGCGWYVDIMHASEVMTRYCHMLYRPKVRVGQTVAAGQPIGIVGTSGHSSGPHLHFEVHLNGDRSSAGATEPSKWMREKGAPLGPGA